MHASVEPGNKYKSFIGYASTAGVVRGFYFLVGLQPEYFTKTINYFIQ